MTTTTAVLGARRTCPRCARDVGYRVPARYGLCLDCHHRTDWRTAA